MITLPYAWPRCTTVKIHWYRHAMRQIENFDFDPQNKIRGMTKGRVTNRRVISESYDFGELCSNHAQTTPTFPNDHTQFRNSPDVSLN
jgi:hypothetical protein